uniref:Uncharacterized protein n=1 Tax=Arundo donax TaxID=35708 RepID=A0A0A9B921_ARUDO
MYISLLRFRAELRVCLDVCVPNSLFESSMLIGVEHF